LCGIGLDIRSSKKNGKPYCICDPCGVQLFIRRKEGINRLLEITGNTELLNKLEQLKRQKAALERERDVFGDDDWYVDYASTSKGKQITQVEEQLRELSKNSRRSK